MEQPLEPASRCYSQASGATTSPLAGYSPASTRLPPGHDSDDDKDSMFNSDHFDEVSLEVQPSERGAGSASDTRRAWDWGLARDRC